MSTIAQGADYRNPDFFHSDADKLFTKIEVAK